MKRYHLIELEDERWFPPLLRNFMTDLLNYQISALGIYDAIVPHLREALEALGRPDILDLCSGGGGPVVRVQRRLAADGCPVRVKLSDKYPNLEAFRRGEAAGDAIDYIPEPLDATDVPARYTGFRTIFTALHHFRPEAARRILADAVTKGAGIGVFELTERSLRGLAPMMMSPLLTCLTTPFVRPFRWERLLLTYGLPVVPAAYFFDGVVSVLRTYTADELRDMVASLGADHYRWSIGEAKHSLLPMKTTYLIGYPREKGGGASLS